MQLCLSQRPPLRTYSAPRPNPLPRPSRTPPSPPPSRSRLCRRTTRPRPAPPVTAHHATPHRPPSRTAGHRAGRLTPLFPPSSPRLCPRSHDARCHPLCPPPACGRSPPASARPTSHAGRYSPRRPILHRRDDRRSRPPRFYCKIKCFANPRWNQKDAARLAIRPGPSITKQNRRGLSNARSADYKQQREGSLRRIKYFTIHLPCRGTNGSTTPASSTARQPINWTTKTYATPS